jgi:hypothetical protein
VVSLAQLTASLLAALLAGALSPRAAAQSREKPSSSDAPPVSMTCPMHPDVVESTPGTCPICKMNLIPVRLESIWTCPVHSVVHNPDAGTCPICRRPLIQMTVALTWTCTDHPEIDQIDRGTCPDGKPMAAKRTLRPHGNHNPQHGGQFFMAPDNTHHLEGAHPRARMFRLYVYDDYARPLPKDQIRRLTARVVTKEDFDPATRTTKELAAFPLVLRNGGYLEARIDDVSLPAQMTAKVKFKDDAPEYRFDFTFPALTREPAPPAAATATAAGRSRPAVTPAPGPPVSGAATAAAGASVPSPGNPGSQATSDPSAPLDPARISPPIPDTTEGILAQLKAANDQIRELVQRGDFGAVWVPAFQARDLAIALEARADRLSPPKREAAEPALKRLVRTAWLLDAFGDVGNRQQIVEAYSIFSSAVGEVASAFATTP